MVSEELAEKELSHLAYLMCANFENFFPKVFKLLVSVEIFSGIDVFEYILCGADAVQIGTAFMQQGPEIYQRIETELDDLMRKKSYSKLDDFQNCLKGSESKLKLLKFFIFQFTFTNEIS